MEITPDFDHPLADAKKNSSPNDLHENMKSAAATAMLLDDLGVPFELSRKDDEAAQELFSTTSHVASTPDKVYRPAVAIKLAALLSEYDRQIVANVLQMRTYITNRLLEISVCGSVKEELRALELLGKLSDVGLFTEKSEITINSRTTVELEVAIRDQIKTLIQAQTTPTLPHVPDPDPTPEPEEFF